MDGKLLVIEGSECTGKSTQIVYLAESFRAAGYNVVTTHEPGGVQVAQEICNVLLRTELEQPMTDLTELLLYEAARAEWIDKIVRPALNKGKIVLTDRSYISTLAYQGYGRGIPIETVKSLNKLAMQGVVPEMVIIFDLEAEAVFQRLDCKEEGKDRIESEPMEFHRKVIEGYRAIARSGEPNIFMIDGTRTIPQIHEDIIDLINRELGLALVAQEGSQK